MNYLCHILILIEGNIGIVYKIKNMIRQRKMLKKYILSIDDILKEIEN
jgi:hypothetical protein